jgi:cellulose synthase/poly-beta-1,6-N-acetylglucosamine synthase-like glycosyltransferase
MKIICLVQVFNEQMFIKRNLENVYDLVDQIVITEGNLSPHGNLSETSTDKTIKEILDFKLEKESAIYDVDEKLAEIYQVGNEAVEFQHNGIYSGGKITLMPAWQGEAKSREEWEGKNKSMMLSYADPDDGDVVMILDADEFTPKDTLCEIINYFKYNPEVNCVGLNEWQFAYGFKWCFRGSHNRFFRYKRGSYFGTTNHFYHIKSHTERIDISRKADSMFDGMLHFSYSRHPQLIRNKVISFNRESFIRWFNTVYLVYPFDKEQAYTNNKVIIPYFGTGWAEGQHTRLEEFKGEFPECLSDLSDICWLDYIRQHVDELRIGKSYSNDEILRIANKGRGFYTP